MVAWKVEFVSDEFEYLAEISKLSLEVWPSFFLSLY